MTTAAVKEKLHKYIDEADDTKLPAIYALTADDIDATERIFTDEVMSLLNEQSELYLAGKLETYTLEESIERISQHRNARKNSLS